ncbi:DUF7684 family protein [Longimicrobium sp.]|uniref:DUF7684 family protein n=1 Tax=Longimicrobium sp. TaxID=2029185 RepID=UPI003B3A4F19
MQQIATHDRRAFVLHAMEPADALPPLFGDEPFAALVWATRPTSNAQKQRITHALIAGGCRYVVCGGAETDAWEEAADDAYLVLDLPDDDVVMTSSHRGEPPDEVVFFLVHSARTDRDFARCLLLVVGADAPVEERLSECVREELDAVGG